MTAALRIARKDIALRIRDRSAFIWGIIAPLGLALVFSLLLGGVTGEGALDVTYVVADEDGGPVAQGFVDVLRELDEQGVLAIEFVADGTEAEERVTTGAVDAGIVIPPDFSSAVSGGSTATIEIIGYVDSPIGTQVARAVVDQFAAEVNGISVAVATHFAAGADGTPGEVVAAAQQTASPLGLRTVSAASKQLSTATFYAGAMAVFFLFFTVQFGVIGLIEEKEQGTMPRLLAAPIHPWSILLGKVVTSFVLGIVSMAVLVVATTWIPFMEAEWGDSIGVTILVVSGVLAAMGVMLLVAAFARTAEGAASMQAIVAFVLGMLGGAFFPVAQTGGLLAKASLVTPHAWFLRGLGDLSAGGSFIDILPAAGYILLFGVVTGGLAMLRLDKTVTS